MDKNENQNQDTIMLHDSKHNKNALGISNCIHVHCTCVNTRHIRTNVRPCA